MKVVINAQFGGFSLSPHAVARLAELQGRTAYFFLGGFNKPYTAVSPDEAAKSFLWFAFDIPNPNEVLADDSDFHAQPIEERQRRNALYSSHALNAGREIERTDPLLLQVIDELGDAAGGKCCTLKVVEIPDGVDYEIEEYDGNEWISEKHRRWE